MRKLFKHLSLTLATALLLSGTPACADEEKAASAIEVDLIVTALSDYRFRGVSFSNEKPAIQPMLTISHTSGIYALLFASNIADYGGSKVEIDAGIGYSRKIGNITADISVLGYFYPGGENVNFREIFGSLSAPVGKGHVKLNASYSPKQKNLGGLDNLYVSISGAMPLASTPFTLNASIGHEKGAFGDNKIDWTLGTDIDISGFTFGVKYMDTSHSIGIPRSGARAVFSISRGF
jgi:uncharacterized protein (TIGR02001 family)